MCQGRRHHVYVGDSSTTLLHIMPYYDDDDVLHVHDSNTVRTTYRCSNGHRWTVTADPSPCPAPGCMWRG